MTPRPVDPIAAFCDDYHDYHNITKPRRLMQIRVLRELEDQLPGSVLDIDAAQLRAYMGWLVNERGLHPNTVRQYRNAIKPLLTWAWERRWISADDLLEMRSVRLPRGAGPYSTPRPYKRKQLDRFWREMEERYPWSVDGTIETAEKFLTRWRKGTSKWNRVQRYAKRLQIEAIVALALYGGLRRDEIFNLQLDDMHPDNEYIVVRARKNKEGEWRERAVPWLGDQMRPAVARWLEFRDELDPPHDRPWLSLHHQAHHRKAMRHRMFEMLLHDIGDGWEFHRMRHTAATIMLRSGIPLDKVSKILGHSRLEQTRQYAEVSHNDLVVVARRIAGDYSRAFARNEEAA
jgi:site-specific recombinase XerD